MLIDLSLVEVVDDFDGLLVLPKKYGYFLRIKKINGSYPFFIFFD